MNKLLDFCDNSDITTLAALLFNFRRENNIYIYLPDHKYLSIHVKSLYKVFSLDDTLNQIIVEKTDGNRKYFLQWLRITSQRLLLRIYGQPLKGGLVAKFVLYEIRIKSILDFITYHYEIEEYYLSDLVSQFFNSLKIPYFLYKYNDLISYNRQTNVIPLSIYNKRGKGKSIIKLKWWELCKLLNQGFSVKDIQRKNEWIECETHYYRIIRVSAKFDSNMSLIIDYKYIVIDTNTYEELIGTKIDILNSYQSGRWDFAKLKDYIRKEYEYEISSIDDCEQIKDQIIRSLD